MIDMAADPLTSRTVDDLLLNDVGFDTDDDPFADKPPLSTERDDKAVLSPRKRKAIDEDAFGGDEEVKIQKQRKKIPKLDAERLLSDPGIPKIRTLLRSGQFKKKLRLKGKGHEFSDTAKLLNYYQMWLDNLYPRAKFADALQLVEKAGHTKKMQMYRKSWIDEGKPGHIRREDMEEAVAQNETYDTTKDHQTSSIEAETAAADEDPASMFLGSANAPGPNSADGPDDDELDALLAEGAEIISRPQQTRQNDDCEGEDDLDALLAQEDSTNTNKILQEAPDDVSEDYDDDLDALLQQQDISLTDANGKHRGGHAADITRPDNDDEGDEMDDLDTLLGAHSSNTEPDLPTPVPNKLTNNGEDVPELIDTISSSPIPNVQTDELDQLLDEHDAAISKANNGGIVEEYLASSPLPNRESQ